MRARAIFVAWVLAAQTLAPSLALASHVRSSCCCAKSEKICHCPGCSKARAIEDGHGLVTQCGHSEVQETTPSLQVATPPQVSLASAADRSAERIPLQTAPPAHLSREVPTPPPEASGL